MRYPKLRELKEAVTALIRGPYTTRFPHVPHVPAERFRGKPVYSDKGCIACGACALVCPARAIEVKDTMSVRRPTRKMVLHLDECHYCGQCSAYCTTKDNDPPGIRHTKEFNLAGFDRSVMVSETEEKELALCELCGDVITSVSHLKWITEKLGPLAFSNPGLFLAKLKSMKLADDIFVSARDYLLRQDRIKIICAKCRRKAAIERF